MQQQSRGRLRHTRAYATARGICRITAHTMTITNLFHQAACNVKIFRGTGVISSWDRKLPCGQHIPREAWLGSSTSNRPQLSGVPVPTVTVTPTFLALTSLTSINIIFKKSKGTNSPHTFVLCHLRLPKFSLSCRNQRDPRHFHHSSWTQKEARHKAKIKYPAKARKK